MTKADLWWAQRDEVLSYYLSGDYATALKRATMLKPGLVLEYSAVSQRFYDEVPFSGSFDQTDRNKLRNHLLKTIVDVSVQGN